MLSFVAQEDQKDQKIQKIDDIPASMDSTKVCAAMGCASKSSAMLSFVAQEDQKGQKIASMDSTGAKVCSVYLPMTCSFMFLEGSRRGEYDRLCDLRQKFGWGFCKSSAATS